MASLRLARFRRGSGPRVLATALFERPLHTREMAAFGTALVAAGTLYCVLYCLIAFPPTHGHMMPVSYSVTWAAFTTLPWFLAFEGWKRAVAEYYSPLRQAATAVGLALLAAISSVVLESLANAVFDVVSRSVSFQAADQLLALLVTAAAAAVARAKRKRADGQTPDEDIETDLPPPDAIDFIVAAGNYIEIRTGDRMLIRRLTMGQAQAALDPARFPRIHRSTIVNRDRIAYCDGRTVRLDDGTALRVGHAHRRSLDPLRVQGSVTSTLS